MATDRTSLLSYISLFVFMSLSLFHKYILITEGNGLSQAPDLFKKKKTRQAIDV
jgi:hypothetical protein